MPQISVRAIDPVTFEPQQGNGHANFIHDQAAVVQIINTRLRLFQGEWFLNLVDGLPMFKLNPSIQAILGGSGNANNIQVIINLITSRIAQSPFVTNVTAVNASYFNRRFKYSAKVQTAFGTVVVTNSPGASATIAVTN